MILNAEIKRLVAAENRSRSLPCVNPTRYRCTTASLLEFWHFLWVSQCDGVSGAKKSWLPWIEPDLDHQKQVCDRCTTGARGHRRQKKRSFQEIYCVNSKGEKMVFCIGNFFFISYTISAEPLDVKDGQEANPANGKGMGEGRK
ncbi:hypothetical protein PAPYR_11183 [Paratrimastix pyriformis]|uniref:Uncharacterized protein n=1 Tax=Paratrimastix pyriformis TaxID=342808 RepID=A0ABQ8U4D8_9EUKA|nr:hypothetical protein PAPYR_11183 [Paratrimastix pyriformis]